MSRPTIAILSKKNLLHNVATLRQKIGSAKIIAMVKSNAYGHGIRSVAMRLEGYVDMFGVASIDEALILRKVGITTPILLMEGVFDRDEFEIAAEHNFHVVFHDQQQIEWLATSDLTQPLNAWIKINTGMGRLGFSLDDALIFYNQLITHPLINKPIRMLSHFACSDDKNNPLNAKQITLFTEYIRPIESEFSLCNSAAIFNFPDHHYNYVRPGIALYGISPLPATSGKSLGLKPVMTFKTKLISTKIMQKGSAIGYGARYICPETMLVGVVACGYGDGYPISARDGTPLLVNDIICPLIGRVSMDMIMVDLRNYPQAHVGDSVVLWGEGLPLEQVAPHTSEIVWNMLTNIQLRVKFIWID